MDEHEQDRSLSRIETNWKAILQARQGAAGEDGGAARRRLLARYWRAVEGYLQRKLRVDPAAAEQVCSDFTLRFLEDDRILAAADPDRGRFRSYLRTILYRMVMDYWRGKKRQDRLFRSLEGAAADAAAPPQEAAADAGEDADLERWHGAVVRKAWRALEREEEGRGGPPYARLLLLKEAEPDATSAQLAEQLAGQYPGPVSAELVRKWAERGRQMFGDRLVAEVASSLRGEAGRAVAAADVEAALIALGLLNPVIRDALERYARKLQRSG
jgi:RNA polymerase sigma-70 factor (ECF subfamily)